MKLILSLLFVGCISCCFYAQKVSTLQNKLFEQSLDQDSITQLNAQGRFRTITGQFHTGGHIYGGESLKPDLHQFYSTTVDFGWQNSKEGNWSKKYGTPIYGFGYYGGNIGNREVFGNPRGVYGFMTFQTSKYYRKNVFGITPSLGLTYQLAKYDPVLNPDNDAISSNVSLYFNMKAAFSYQLTRELDLVYGIDFMHSSNGRLFVPNYGLNMLGINVGLTYYHNREQKNYDRYTYSTKVLPSRYHRQPREKNDKIKENSISLYGAVGNVQNYPDEDGETNTGKRYWTSSVVLDYNYRYNTMISFTGGLDYFYDSSLVSYPEYRDRKDWNLYGIHGGADFNFWKMAVRLQAGTYLGSDKGKDKLFLRPALIYQANDWLKFQVGLKTRRGFGADWIEWGIVLVPVRWK